MLVSEHQLSVRSRSRCCAHWRLPTGVPLQQLMWVNAAMYRYKAWKEAGLSQALDADLPVSTGAVWGLQKNTWSSQ